MDYINFAFLILSSGFFLFLSVSSIYEKEKRASLISFLFALIMAPLWGGLIILNSTPVIRIINLTILSFAFIILVISLIKYFPKKPLPNIEKITQFDERDHMFSRMSMQKFPDNSEKYYKLNPDMEAVDKKIAKDPNLGDPGAKFYDKYYSPIVNSAFTLLERTSEIRSGKTSINKNNLDVNEVSKTIRWMANYYGAIEIGITELKEHHLYSHHGRHEKNWGDPVTNKHKYGIVIVVKMDQDMIGQAPSLPVLLESAKQYVESAKIAHLVAEYIRELGYDAVSHIDGNYEILAVPMAKDAGLGEIGRMGILIHRKLGPSVRLSAVTTDMPLPPSDLKDEHIEEFCNICKKCAVNCPTGSVPKEDKPANRNFEHWSIDQQSCYSYWRKSGTDCGFCIRVCPYTKKDTFIHRIIRAYISRNPVNQRIALIMDDIFYGRKFRLKTQDDQKKFFKVSR
ncbi:MAG: reductive dehalogenase [Candidatus Aminicenantes bacterium]|nr:reductive dehalogenase [Candidatus Aminicenantes bacterium]